MQHSVEQVIHYNIYSMKQRKHKIKKHSMHLIKYRERHCHKQNKQSKSPTEKNESSTLHISSYTHKKHVQKKVHSKLSGRLSVSVLNQPTRLLPSSLLWQDQTKATCFPCYQFLALSLAGKSGQHSRVHITLQPRKIPGPKLYTEKQQHLTGGNRWQLFHCQKQGVGRCSDYLTEGKKYRHTHSTSSRAPIT